jgi:hypothetical protein
LPGPNCLVRVLGVLDPFLYLLGRLRLCALPCHSFGHGVSRLFHGGGTGHKTFDNIVDGAKVSIGFKVGTYRVPRNYLYSNKPQKTGVLWPVIATLETPCGRGLGEAVVVLLAGARGPYRPIKRVSTSETSGT